MAEEHHIPKARATTFVPEYASCQKSHWLGLSLNCSLTGSILRVLVKKEVFLVHTSALTDKEAFIQILSPPRGHIALYQLQHHGSEAFKLYLMVVQRQLPNHLSSNNNTEERVDVEWLKRVLIC